MISLMSCAIGTVSASAPTVTSGHSFVGLPQRLIPGGTALLDVSNPFVWARWHGDQEHKPARPELGYHYDLGEVTRFDPVNSRFADTWWATDNPGETWTQ